MGHTTLSFGGQNDYRKPVFFKVRLPIYAIEYHAAFKIYAEDAQKYLTKIGAHNGSSTCAMLNI